MFFCSVCSSRRSKDQAKYAGDGQKTYDEDNSYYPKQYFHALSSARLGSVPRSKICACLRSRISSLRAVVVAFCKGTCT